jgi:hypothetical protein
VLFEELHFALVPFCRLPCFERAQITAFAGLSVSLPRVEAIFTGFQLPNHFYSFLTSKLWFRVCALKEDLSLFPIHFGGKRSVPYPWLMNEVSIRKPEAGPFGDTLFVSSVLAMVELSLWNSRSGGLVESVLTLATHNVGFRLLTAILLLMLELSLKPIARLHRDLLQGPRLFKQMSCARHD